MGFDGTAVFGGIRSQRYALKIEDGKVTATHIEPDGTGANGKRRICPRFLCYMLHEIDEGLTLIQSSFHGGKSTGMMGANRCSDAVMKRAHEGLRNHHGVVNLGQMPCMQHGTFPYILYEVENRNSFNIWNPSEMYLNINGPGYATVVDGLLDGLDDGVGSVVLVALQHLSPCRLVAPHTRGSMQQAPHRD